MGNFISTASLAGTAKNLSKTVAQMKSICKLLLLLFGYFFLGGGVSKFKYWVRVLALICKKLPLS